MPLICNGRTDASLTNCRAAFAARQRAGMARARRSRLSAILGASLLSGCSGAPMLLVDGAYVPAWLICAIIGVLAALLTRVAMAAGEWGQALPLRSGCAWRPDALPPLRCG